jgi:hypothetical protein
MMLDELLRLLRTRLSRTTTADDIAALMAPYASDSAWVYLGGSGARQQIFRLEHGLRAAFELDGHDQLVAYAAYESREPWTPDRMMPVGAEVPLILV